MYLSIVSSCSSVADRGVGALGFFCRETTPNTADLVDTFPPSCCCRPAAKTTSDPVRQLFSDKSESLFCFSKWFSFANASFYYSQYNVYTPCSVCKQIHTSAWSFLIWSSKSATYCFLLSRVFWEATLFLIFLSKITISIHVVKHVYFYTFWAASQLFLR